MAELRCFIGLGSGEPPPVRTLLYVPRLVALAAAVAGPVAYGAAPEQYGVWIAYASGLAQVAATACLFERLQGVGGPVKEKTGGVGEVR